MRILVVEDDLQIAQFLKTSLEKEYFVVDVVYDGERGSFLGRTNDYDLIILDNMLPKKEGRQVCQEIRKKNHKVKILLLSVRSEIPKKVEMLNAGVDDYLTKPFSFSELLARIKALLRRSGETTDDILRIDDLVLDKNKCEVKKRNKPIYLTKKEFMLLELLLRNKGNVVSKGNIIEQVWDMEMDPFSNTLETHIGNLRHKLGNRRLIRTVSGRGYKI